MHQLPLKFTILADEEVPLDLADSDSESEPDEEV